MKKIISLSIMLSCSIYSFGQQQEEINLLQADSTWGKEIIQIPFWFAPDIYLNMQLKWYDNDNQVNNQSDQLKNIYAMYHSLSIIYLYYPMKINAKDFTR